MPYLVCTGFTLNCFLPLTVTITLWKSCHTEKRNDVIYNFFHWLPTRDSPQQSLFNITMCTLTFYWFINPTGLSRFVQSNRQSISNGLLFTYALDKQDRDHWDVCGWPSLLFYLFSLLNLTILFSASTLLFQVHFNSMHSKLHWHGQCRLKNYVKLSHFLHGAFVVVCLLFDRCHDNRLHVSPWPLPWLSLSLSLSLSLTLQVVSMGLYLGDRAYLRSSWNVLDGFLVFVSLIDIVVSMAGGAKILGVLRVLRLLRTLRPLR